MIQYVVLLHKKLTNVIGIRSCLSEECRQAAPAAMCSCIALTG